MEILKILIPSAVTFALGVLSSIVSVYQFNKQTKRDEEKTRSESETALKRGLQAQLRYSLYESFNRAESNGSVTEFERELFESMYESYHALGENGIMDDIRERFLDIEIKG